MDTVRNGFIHILVLVFSVFLTLWNEEIEIKEKKALRSNMEKNLKSNTK